MPGDVNLRQAAALLGADEDTGALLVRRGILASRQPRPGGPRAITWPALVACVQDRRFWLALSYRASAATFAGPRPRLPADPMLREYMRRAIGVAAPARWWRPADLAAACHIDRATVRLRRARGWGDASRWERWGPHWHWWGAAPPPWEPEARLSGVRYLELRGQLGSWVAVAAAVGKPVDAVRSAGYRAARALGRGL